jgi:hypothetical protein
VRSLLNLNKVAYEIVDATYNLHQVRESSGALTLMPVSNLASGTFKRRVNVRT